MHNRDGSFCVTAMQHKKNRPRCVRPRCVPISRLNVPEGIAVAAIQSGTKVIIPDDNTRIETGDKLVVVALLSETDDLEKLLKTKQGFFG